MPFSRYRYRVGVASVNVSAAPVSQPVVDTARHENVAALLGHPVPRAITVSAWGLITQLEMDSVVPANRVRPASNTPQP